MKTEIIKAIFTNLLFVIGVVLTIIGFTQGTLTVARMVVFDKYPLQTYDETRCDVDQSMPVVGPDGKTTVVVSKEETAARHKSCLASLEQQRKTKEVEDIVTSVSMLFAGAVLIVSFRKFIYHTA